MGSSISLTLWAFLGMESAAQNSAAVENPKRDVPLACMFGTLGAAVIYILSTTVIQGIVPNAELAESTGPFGAGLRPDVQPDDRLDHHGARGRWPASARCSAGSSRSPRPGKSAADERMFPAFFSKVNRLGAPITGMIVLGVVQTLLALMTISPTLSEQFSALVNLAVVTNVRALHHLALGADGDDEGGRVAGAQVPPQRRRGAGGDALQRLRALRLGQGGRDGRHAGDRDRLHHLGLPRAAFQPSRLAVGRASQGRLNALDGAVRKEIKHAMRTFEILAERRLDRRFGLAVLAAVLMRLAARTASAATLDRVKQTGKLTLGYQTDARPFSYRDEAGKPAGYAVALCQKIADQVKAELGLPRSPWSGPRQAS